MMNTHVPYSYQRSTIKPFDEALFEARTLLKQYGFGVLCEIDVAKTLKEKINAEFPRYVILGACNPQFAYEALSSEAQLGLLLPCNVVIQQQGNKTIVSAVDAKQLLSIVGRAELEPIAAEVNVRLRAVVDGVTS
jgi:uncharacterized protein (DUF302 family)